MLPTRRNFKERELDDQRGAHAKCWGRLDHQATGSVGRVRGSKLVVAGSGPTVAAFLKSAHPESNQGPSDYCMRLQSDALPTDLAGVIRCRHSVQLRDPGPCFLGRFEEGHDY